MLGFAGTLGTIIGYALMIGLLILIIAIIAIIVIFTIIAIGAVIKVYRDSKAKNAVGVTTTTIPVTITTVSATHNEDPPDADRKVDSDS